MAAIFFWHHCGNPASPDHTTVKQIEQTNTSLIGEFNLTRVEILIHVLIRTELAISLNE